MFRLSSNFSLHCHSLFFVNIYIVSFKILLFVIFSSKILLGQTTFIKTYGDTTESHYDRGSAVLQTEDGGFIVAGDYGQHYVGTPIHYYGDVYLIRTDEYGDTLWTKTYGDINVCEVAYSMDKTGDGGYIVSSFIQHPLWQFWLIKIDFQGDTLWTKKFDLAEGNHISTTSDNGFVITGREGYHLPDDNVDVYLLKLDSRGNMQWLKKYDKNLDEEGIYVQQTSDGGYIIAGVTRFPEPRGFDIWLIKTNSKGDTLWTKIYGGDYIDEAHSVCETKDGGYLIAGEYAEDGPLGLEVHIWLLKTDANGDTIWTRKINNGSWGDYANAMKKTSDGGFIIVGETTYDNFDSDIYLIKLDKEGNLQWDSTYGQNFGGIGDKKQYRGNDIAETSDGGFIITGFKWFWIGLFDEYQDLCLLKVNDTTSANEIPLDYALLQNFPNPFNTITQIKFRIPKRGRVILALYDLLGKEVITLLNEEKEYGTYTVSWDGKDKNGMNVGSGIYLYQLRVGTFNRCGKMVLIR